MIRIPIGNERSSRIEVRTVAPDSNPYLCFYTLISAGLAGMNASETEFQKMENAVFGHDVEKLPGDIFAALEYFSESDFMKEILGADNQQKYASLKKMAADRSPRMLGTRVKTGEIVLHHEVTNQMLWGEF